jgi:hypothetical protein
MQAILSSSKLAVLVNGSPGPWITCKRGLRQDDPGLRQDDPLSPYFFLLVAETLQCLIKAKSESLLHPVNDDLPCAIRRWYTHCVQGGHQWGHCIENNPRQLCEHDRTAHQLCKEYSGSYPHGRAIYTGLCSNLGMQKRGFPLDLSGFATVNPQIADLSIHTLHSQDW